MNYLSSVYVNFLSAIVLMNSVYWTPAFSSEDSLDSLIKKIKPSYSLNELPKTPTESEEYINITFPVDSMDGLDCLISERNSSKIPVERVGDSSVFKPAISAKDRFYYLHQNYFSYTSERDHEDFFNELSKIPKDQAEEILNFAFSFECQENSSVLILTIYGIIPENRLKIVEFTKKVAIYRGCETDGNYIKDIMLAIHQLDLNNQYEINEAIKKVNQHWLDNDFFQKSWYF